LRSLLFPTHVVAAGEAAGLKLFARRADPAFASGTYELPVQKIVASNLPAGAVFYDVGANIGFFSLIAARVVGPRGQVYAFEPVPRNAASIERSARLNAMSHIHVFRAAVGARAGRSELVLTRHIGGATLASAGTPHDAEGRIEVEVVTIDELIAARTLHPPSLVKIDVEGAEADVLQGMQKTLVEYRPLILYEVDDATSEGLARKAEAIARILRAAGYSIEPLPASYPHLAWRVEHRLARFAGQ
jgi:FkbM family methyltransferase